MNDINETIMKLKMPNVYLPPAGGPLRWQDDVTGVFPRAIKAFMAEGLGHTPATPEQVELVRDYCQYYINAPCWEVGSEEDTPKLFKAFKELRERIKSLRTSREIALWISDCLNIGIDPL
jgi:hypothetical protein